MTTADPSWLESFIVERWGAKEVFVHNTLYTPFRWWERTAFGCRMN